MKPVAPRSRDKLHLSVAGDFEARILSGALGIGEPLPSEADRRTGGLRLSDG